MFLNQLKETNKEDFLKVCVYASLANGVFADEEKDMLFAYCREMNIKEHVPETPEALEVLMQKIREKTNIQEKRIFVLEILALVKADGVYDDQENQFMKKMLDGLQLSDDVLKIFETLLEKYIRTGKELFDAISQ